MACSNDTPTSKACKKCGQHKPLTAEYWEPQKAGRYGFTARCRECRRAEYAAIRAMGDQKARQKAWRDANKPKVAAYNAEYRKAGYVSTEHVADWRRRNIEHARATGAQRNRERRRSDPEYSILCRMRARLSAMKRGKASKRTEQLLGYTMQELKDHIQRQFTRGMTWDKFMAGEIHIDHIVPVAAFNITSLDCEDFKRCWALSNLRPLWAEDNRAKGARLEVMI